MWVGNREYPLNDTSGFLQFTSQGNVVLKNSKNLTVWSGLSNLSRQVQNPVAQLLDTGNLVVREGNDTNEDGFIWESFDYLSDTFLPAVKFGRNLVTGIERYLVSWKSGSDPSLGDSTTELDPSVYPQIYIRVGKSIVLRSGPWNGIRFGGMPNLKKNLIYTFGFVYNDEEIYYRYDLIDKSLFSWMKLTNEGVLQRFTWTNSSRVWNLYLTAQMDNCDRYRICGAYRSCNINNLPACVCSKGFTLKFPQDWESGDWSGRCVRNNESICEAKEGFRW